MRLDHSELLEADVDFVARAIVWNTEPTRRDQPSRTAIRFENRRFRQYIRSGADQVVTPIRPTMYRRVRVPL